jgi:hypothetical protein
MPKQQQKTRRNTLPRKSSPKGVEARVERRAKTWPSKGVMKAGGGNTPIECHKPGSRNPRKVGR